MSADCVIRVHPETGQPIGMRQQWGIILSGPWETDNAWMVAEGMNTMAEQVGDELGSQESGDAWVSKMLGDTQFVRWPNNTIPIHPILLLTEIHTLYTKLKGLEPIWSDGPSGLALPAHYPLLDNDADTIYFFDSMYDTTPVHESAHIIDYRSGYVSVDMAKSVDLGRSPTEYGKTNRLEDFAESWKIWIYDKPGLTGTRRSFIENLIVQWR